MIIDQASVTLLTTVHVHVGELRLGDVLGPVPRALAVVLVLVGVEAPGGAVFGAAVGGARVDGRGAVAAGARAVSGKGNGKY